MIETLDLSKIRKGLQFQDDEILNKYLKDIWSDLSKRTKNITIYQGLYPKDFLHVSIKIMTV